MITDSAEQKMRMIAWDISYHFRNNWQGKTPLKVSWFVIQK